MNYAHLHLLINHFPIVGNSFSILLYIWAFISKKKEVMQVALGFTIIVAITGYLTDYTGDHAYDQVKQLPGVVAERLKAHAQSAGISLDLLYASGAVALISLVLLSRNQRSAKYFIYLAFVLTITDAYFIYHTGNLGGLIRHPEISFLMNHHSLNA